MLTGAVPFTADTPLAVALKQVSEAPRPPREIVSAIPAELERVVMHALAKDPRARPADANAFRRELHAVAANLGLEHADSLLSPSLADLRNAGTESPSGRLVIDLATLRQVQAASAGDSFTAEVRKEQTGASDPRNPKRPEFARMNVSLARAISPKGQNRFRLAAATLVVIAAILGSALLAARWWPGNGVGDGGHTASADSAASPSPSVSPTPSPSPSPLPKPTRKPEPRKEKPSKIKSIWNKMKGILKP
jgi:serine/threonine-protein kinase